MQRDIELFNTEIRIESSPNKAKYGRLVPVMLFIQYVVVY